MAQPYKLKDEIKQFILEKKKENLKLSCRSIPSLIKANFGINLSKSTINAIIKENNLSSKAGRPRTRENIILPVAEIKSIIQPNEIAAIIEPVIPALIPEPVSLEKDSIAVSEPVDIIPQAQPIEIKQVIEQGQYYLKNGGSLFLLIADQKSGLTEFISGKFSVYLPNMDKGVIRMLIQAKIYGEIFPERASLWRLLGKELACGDLDFYYEQLSKIPLNQPGLDFTNIGLAHNINEISQLYKQSLFQLNSQAQELFFPPGYQFLDFATMHDRFYSLIAGIEKKAELILLHFFCQEDFKLINDIVWQEDFKFAVNRINEEKIAINGEQFRCVENIGFLNLKTVSFK